MMAEPRRPGESGDIVEEASRESFPASDPPAWTPVEGARTEALAQAQQELAETKDRLLRALAEQENARRRSARERDDAVRFAASELARDLLPTLDNLRRALDAVPEEGRAPVDEPLRNIIAGVTATERAMLDALAKHGIVRIDPTRGEAFDPHRHEAINEVDASGLPAGTVAETHQPGYAQHGRLLRPATVAVARGGGEAQDRRGG